LEEIMKIGFIGLGIMGVRMAANLQKAGYDLVVHNRTKAKADELVANGAVWADTPADAAEDVDILVTVLAHPEAVKEAALGEDGFLEVMPIDAVWMDSSTVNPSFSREMAAAAEVEGVHLVDAPVAGSKDAAAAGSLIFITGGSSEVIEKCRPLMDVMGQNVMHMGEAVGTGTSTKVLFNALLAQSMLAFAEGLALGEAMGIDRDKLMDMLIGGPVVAPFVAGKRPFIEADDYDPHFPLKWMRKDLQLATQTGYEVGAPMPSANAAKEVYALAVKHGLGDLDFSAIYKFLSE
jgi:3-hydroxyisobutyrate dehydrogenase-like beta-hydroxyacid dehydrogenase